MNKNRKGTSDHIKNRRQCGLRMGEIGPRFNPSSNKQPALWRPLNVHEGLTPYPRSCSLHPPSCLLKELDWAQEHMWSVCVCVNSTACTHSECCIRSVKHLVSGLLVEPLKVKGGVIKQWVLHLHFPGLKIHTQRRTAGGWHSSVSQIKCFSWLSSGSIYS